MEKRTAREISIKNEDFDIKIGTTENRICPETVYISFTFWVKSLKEIGDIKEEKNIFNKYIKEILNNKFSKFIDNNIYFPLKKNNILISEIPESFNFQRFNFVSLGIYLHTLNNVQEQKYTISSKKDTELFNECVNVSNYVIKELELLKSEYVFKKKSVNKKGTV